MQPKIIQKGIEEYFISNKQKTIPSNSQISQSKLQNITSEQKGLFTCQKKLNTRVEKNNQINPTQQSQNLSNEVQKYSTAFAPSGSDTATQNKIEQSENPSELRIGLKELQIQKQDGKQKKKIESQQYNQSLGESKLQQLHLQQPKNIGDLEVQQNQNDKSAIIQQNKGVGVGVEDKLQSATELYKIEQEKLQQEQKASEHVDKSCLIVPTQCQQDENKRQITDNSDTNKNITENGSIPSLIELEEPKRDNSKQLKQINETYHTVQQKHFQVLAVSIANNQKKLPIRIKIPRKDPNPKIEVSEEKLQKVQQNSSSVYSNIENLPAFRIKLPSYNEDHFQDNSQGENDKNDGYIYEGFESEQDEEVEKRQLKKKSKKTKMIKKRTKKCKKNERQNIVDVIQSLSQIKNSTTKVIRQQLPSSFFCPSCGFLLKRQKGYRSHSFGCRHPWGSLDASYLGQIMLSHSLQKSLTILNSMKAVYAIYDPQIISKLSFLEKQGLVMRIDDIFLKQKKQTMTATSSFTTQLLVNAVEIGKKYGKQLPQGEEKRKYKKRQKK